MDRKILVEIKETEHYIIRSIMAQKDETVTQINNARPPTHTQMQIMSYIIKKNGQEVHQRELEDALHLRRATVSGVLATMEKNNIITRVKDDVDTRTKKIILNDKAKKIFLSGSKKIDKIEKVTIDGIDENDLETFLRVLDRMKSNLKQYNKSIGIKEGKENIC